MNTKTVEQKPISKPPTSLAIDFSELYRRVRAARESAVHQSAARANDEALHKLGSHSGDQLQGVDLPTAVGLGTPKPVLARVAKLSPLGSRISAAPVRLHRLEPETYGVVVATSEGIDRPFDLEIPAGLPRFTNVATLRRLVDASDTDIVFRRGQGQQAWEICSDDDRVDLEDRTQEFRVRQWTILS